MFLKRQKWVFVVVFCAIIVGVFYAGPQALIWKKLSDQGKPFVSIQMTHRGDINQVYMPKAREVYDGHFPPVDFHQENTKELSSIFPALPPLIFSIFLFISRGDPNVAMLTADFVLPAIIFIFFYVLGRVVVKNKLWSLFLAFLGTLTPLSIHLPHAFKSVDNFLNIAVKNFYLLVNTKLDKLFLDRIDDPLLTYLVFIPAIILLFYFWQKPNKKTAFWAGLFNGFLAYTYFHYWVYMMVVIGILFFLTLLWRREKVKPFLVLLGILIATLIPYFVMYFQFNNLSSAVDYIARIKIEEGRFFRLLEPFSVLFDYIFYVLLAGLIYWVFRKKDRNKILLYESFVGSMFVVWNVQLVTGFIPHPDHFWKAISMAVLVILFDIAYQISKKINKKYIFAGLIVLMVLLGVKKIVNLIYFINPEPQFVEAGTFESYTFDKDIVDSWQWIESNLPKEPVILSDSLVTSIYLLSYTSARPYVMTGFNTIAPNEEIANRFLMANKLFNVSAEVVKERLKASPMSNSEEWQRGDRHSAFNKFKSAQHMFYNAFRQDTAEYRYINEEIANNLTKIYKKLNISWENLPTEYVYYGPWEKEFSQIKLNNNPDLELLFKNDSVEIYKVIKK